MTSESDGNGPCHPLGNRKQNVYKPAEDCGTHLSEMSAQMSHLRCDTTARTPSQCVMQSCSESTLDMILISQNMLSSLSLSKSRLFLLAQCKKWGLGICALDSAFIGILLNKILYALPVHLGYLSKGHKYSKEPIKSVSHFTDMTCAI